MIVGYDISAVQGPISPSDWEAMAKAGVRFVYLRCGVGNDGPDGRWAANVAGASAAGIAVGAYHFAYPIPHCDPALQAQSHLAACSAWGSKAGELPPALDLEWPTQVADSPRNAWPYWGCSPDQIRAWALTYLDVAAGLYGTTPLLYTYPDFWHQIAGATEPRFAHYPLWLAQYANQPHPLGPWAGWTVWQQSGGGGRLPSGAPVDVDAIADEATFTSLLARPVASTLPAPPP